MGVSRSSVFPQVAARKTYKHILKACLTCGQAQEMLASSLYCVEQRRDSQVRLMHIEAHETIVMPNRLDARKCSPGIDSAFV